MNKSKWFSNSKPVTLDEILQAREDRKIKQMELLSSGQYTLICFTLNIPGENKVYPLSKKAFDAGLKAINEQCLLENFNIQHHETTRNNTGYEGYWTINSDATIVKKSMIEIESMHPIGRLFDIDVFDAFGTPIKGSDWGRAERSCLICDEPVWACARSRKHSISELSLKVANTIYNYITQRFIDTISLSATRAALYEVSTSPKPGLVDRFHNGSHRDMDFFTFIDSSCALIPYFRNMVSIGCNYEGSLDSFLPRLRYAGKLAESSMSEMTNGINTHKGLIFSLGIMCAAVGYLYNAKKQLTLKNITSVCSKIAFSTAEELFGLLSEPLTTSHECTHTSPILKTTVTTHGESIYSTYGFEGIRGEVAKGFPNVVNHGYPILKKYVTDGVSLNDAGVITLLHLIAHANDTNILYRSNLRRMQKIQQDLQKSLRSEKSVDGLLKVANSLDLEFISENISPGGSADLLAVSFMLFFILDE